MKTICIIPARKGSKRIPGKNFREFCGQPIIEYPIAAAKESGLFDEIILATDANMERSDITVYHRSPGNATDSAELEDVLAEVLDMSPCDLCCLLLPTAVFVTAELLQRAFNMLIPDGDGDYIDIVLPIIKYDYPPQRALKYCRTIDRHELVDTYYADKNAQDIETYYHDAGMFYVIPVDYFLYAWGLEYRLLEMKCIGIEIPRTQAHDIDTEEDWKIAEMKWVAMNEKRDIE